MFQFRAFPSYAYLIQRTIRRYCLRGFPHSEISGSTDICSSPKLIAACHVLRRLLMPRHSPCALYSLTFRRCGLHILRCNASVSAHPFRHISSSNHEHFVGLCFEGDGGCGLAISSFSTFSSLEIFGSLELCRQSQIHAKLLLLPSSFQMLSTIKINFSSFKSP